MFKRVGSHGAGICLIVAGHLLAPLAQAQAQAQAQTQSQPQPQTLHIGRSEAGSELTDRAEAVLKAAYAVNGTAIVFDKYPLRRSLELSNAGAIDGEAIRVGELDPAYRNLIRLDTPVTYFNMALYARAPCPVISAKDELQGRRIAYERGVLAFERLLGNMPSAEAADTEDVLKMVKRGVVELGLLVDVEGDTALRAASDPALCRVQPFAMRVNLYHYLHRKHRDLAIRLEKTLAAMARSGEIQRLNDQQAAKSNATAISRLHGR